MVKLLKKIKKNIVGIYNDVFKYIYFEPRGLNVLVDDNNAWYLKNSIIPHAMGNIENKNYTNSKEALENILAKNICKKRISMMYNGLQNDMTSFAKFAFIFEQEIKVNVKNEEFKSRFKAAFELYEHKVKCHVRYVKQKDIATVTDYAKFTLFFTKKHSQVLDFCRHLRNSFVHGILIKEDKFLIINDKNNRQKVSSKGYLEYRLVKEFVKEIVNVYEHKN